jgi:hypothetical protein
MTSELDRYVVMKLISGEEVLGTLVKEDDYELKIQFPMVVKHLTRVMGGYPTESIVLGAYSHFCADDEFTFHKQHVVVLKDMNPRYIDEYHRSVDDFLGHVTPPEPYNPEELKQLTEKLQNMFRDRIDGDEDLPESIHIDGSKTIH